MSATNATLLYIGAKPYPKPPIDSAPNDFSFSAKRFFNLLRSIFGCTDSVLRTLSYCSPYSTSHKQFLARKGSLPSDLFCTNVLR